jgi:class 3 adenylate cyclase
MQSISEWLQSLGLEQYAQAFADNDIDLGLLTSLSEQDLKELDVSSMGHRKKLLKAIAELGGAMVADPSSLPTTQRLPSDSGERRHATVLFSDLSGFTAMTEQLDPEEVQTLVRQLKDGAVEIVETHGGIVSQFVGDEVLALFGIPAAHEDDPLRAVRAAAEIHALARELSPQVEEKIGRALAMHTGIATGLMVTSSADDRDGRIGVTGDTVNTGARMKALAADDTILLSRATAGMVDAFVRVESLDPTELKGKSAPVTPYRVVGEIATGTSRFEATAARHGFTAFAGRERELATLQQALERANSGHGSWLPSSGRRGWARAACCTSSGSVSTVAPPPCWRAAASPTVPKLLTCPCWTPCVGACGFTN